MRLLITETDPLVRRWLGTRADELGIQLDFASGSQELMEAIDDQLPDCVILDASSSRGCSAPPLWRQLRDTPETRNIPVLLYSSSDRWQAVAEQEGTAVDGYIPRPFTADVVVLAAQRAAERRQAERME